MVRRDKFGEDLNELVPVKNPGELRRYSGWFYERDWNRGPITTSQQTYAEEEAGEYNVEGGRSFPFPRGLKLSDSDHKDEPLVFFLPKACGLADVAGYAD